MAIIKNINIKTPTIRLEQFLKWAEIVGSGGEAKHLIKTGGVKVNSILETKRARILKPGDQVELDQEVVLLVVRKEE